MEYVEAEATNDELQLRRELYTKGTEWIKGARIKGEKYHCCATFNSLIVDSAVILVPSYRVQICQWSWETPSPIFGPAVTFRIRPAIAGVTSGQDGILGGRINIPVKTYYTTEPMTLETPIIDESFLEELDLTSGKKELVPGTFSGQANEVGIRQSDNPFAQ
jgi:hypothetical protein